MINCSQTKFEAIVVIVLVFVYAKFSLDHFAFLLEHSVTSWVTSSRFTSF